jgi:hypothetical protein
MADGKVNVPIVGQTNKSTLFIAGLAGVTALGWAWWKNKKQAATKQANATAAATTAASAQNSYAYGYGYGAYNYQPYGYGFGPSGLGEYGGGTGEYGYGYYGAGEPVNEEVPGAAATNAQWSEAAVTALTSAGWASTDVLTALGLYITGSPLSATQQQIIQAAIAAEGYPPSPGASGYPPAINTSAPTGQSSTTSAGGMVTVPNVSGQDASQAVVTLKNAGLVGIITLDSTSNKPGIFHVITKTVPAAGTSVPTGSQVTMYYQDSSSAAS